MTLYPLFADLSGLPVLVVGGGAIAERKIEALLASGAQVRVGARELCPTLKDWMAQERITYLGASFQPDWLDNVWLVIAATNDHELNQQIATLAQQRRLFANVVDDAALSRFQVPAVVDRSPLTVAISTAGAAPALARRIRESLELLLDNALGELISLAQTYRTQITRRLPDMATRRAFYDWLHDGPVMSLLRSAQPVRAGQVLQEALVSPNPALSRGEVLLVGTGPGDPGLLTLHALRALNRADVILHDQLVSPAVLALARRDAERIDVGKRCGGRHTQQEHIHRVLLEHARAGRCVVRLKGGDPFVFGRGGEEMEFLRSHGVPCRIIPGITAAIACAAYAGIPLTHRDHARSLHVLAAHGKDAIGAMDWPALAQSHQTLAIYMSVSRLAEVRQFLLEHGRHPGTPFAIIENGSLPQQRVLHGSLDKLAVRAEQYAIQSPALLIIGEVAALARGHEWFGAAEQQPAAVMEQELCEHG